PMQSDGVPESLCSSSASVVGLPRGPELAEELVGGGEICVPADEPDGVQCLRKHYRLLEVVEPVALPALDAGIATVRKGLRLDLLQPERLCERERLGTRLERAGGLAPDGVKCDEVAHRLGLRSRRLRVAQVFDGGEDPDGSGVPVAPGEG